MKKNLCVMRRCQKNIHLRKIWMTMKLTMVLFFLAITNLMATETYSQATKLTLQVKDETVREVLSKIEENSEFFFLYNGKLVDVDRKISMDVNDLKISDILNNIFQGTNVVYAVVDRQIVLTDKANQTGFVQPGSQQPQKITGTVTDKSGTALPGVNVVVTGTTQGTLTDVAGKYSIEITPAGKTLTFTFIGMQTQEVTIGTLSQINVTMAESSINLDEVVVVGYGTQKKSTLTGAISSVKGDVVERAGASNIGTTLTGNVSGITVSPSRGLPGETPLIHIRGIGTTGNSAPLVVVDGIIRNNLGDIDPAIIESVTVLKDAAAVAPYGMGGANGVILINTKKGNNGTPTVSLNSYYGMETPTWLPHTLNAVDYFTLKNEVGPGTYSDEFINTYNSKHAADPDLYPDSNPRDLLKTIYTPVQDYNLKISGGSDKIRYYFGGDFFRENNLFPGIYGKQYKFNFNLESKVTKTTTISANGISNFQQSNDLYPQKPSSWAQTDVVFGSTSSSEHLFEAWFKQSPNDPMQFSNGLPSSSHGNTFAGILNSKGYNKGDRSTFLSTYTVEQQLPFIEGLSLKGVFSFDLTNNFVKGWGPTIDIWSLDATTTPYTYNKSAWLGLGNSNPFLNESQSKYQQRTYQGYLNYQRTFGAHAVSFLGVAEWRTNKYNRFASSKLNFIAPVDEFDMGSSDPNDFKVSGTSSEAKSLGYIYRATYAFKNKYLIDASGRYDGSFYFATGKRFAFFPAFSVAWRLSEEKFIKNLTFINNLKIRASWGKSGNFAGAPYQYQAAYLLAPNQYAFGNGTMVSSSNQAIESNPEITWELSTKSDIGFEIGLWENLLTVEADYFHERRTGMLLAPNIVVPIEYGINLADENAGIMENNGFELNLGSKHEFKNGLKLSLVGNLSYARNKMIQIFESDATYNNPDRRLTGRPYGTPFGYHSLGLVSTDRDKNGDGWVDQADGYTIQQRDHLHVGDIEYADINGDGKIDVNDQVPVGHTVIPELVYGVSTAAEWKGFDLTAFIQGAALSSINVNNNCAAVPFMNDQSNTDYEYFNNRWTPTHQNALFPRATGGQTPQDHAPSDFWYRNGDYLRLKNLVFGFTVPKEISQKLKISNLRFYLSGTNLFTLNKIKFIDPESRVQSQYIDFVSYPPVKNYILGINVTF